MLMHKNSVKQQIRMGSHQEDFLNPSPCLSTIRFMMNLMLSLEGTKRLGLVLMQKEVNGSTQIVEMNWNFKIGTQVNQIMVHMTVSISFYPTISEHKNGLISLATTNCFSFVSLSN